MAVPVMLIVALVVGLAIGAFAGSKWSPAVAQAKQLRAELERLRQEHDGYRASVNAHFRKTADLVGQMTKSYAAVYDHLAGGARRFCDGETGDGELAFSPLPGSLAAPAIETDAEPPAEAPAAESAVADAASGDTAEGVDFVAQADDAPAESYDTAAEAATDFGDFATDEVAATPDETQDPSKNA